MPTNANKPSTSAPQLLLVDDDALLIFDLEVTLSGAGFEICGVARNSSRALRLAQHRDPDAILMNVDLGGGVDGITTAIMMRAIGLHMPIVFLTGHVDSTTRERAASVENSWYVSKPAMPQVLEEILREALISQ